MGGKGSGNRSMSNPAVAKKASNVDPDANSRVIAYMRELWNLPQIDLGDPAAVEDRIDLFFSMCADHGMRPLVGNLAANFGMSQPLFSSIMNGTRSGKDFGVTPETTVILKKAYSYVNAIFEQSMLNAKNPVPFIYYTKAQLDWREAPNETVITHRSESPRLSGGSADEIAGKYLDMVAGSETPKLPPIEAEIEEE